jgi:hypothetical protein
VEEQLGYHRLQHRLDKCETTIQRGNGVATTESVKEMERIDKQTVEIQTNAESKCRRLIDHNNLPFSETVQTWIKRKRVYQGLIRRHDGKCSNQSNLVKFAWKMEVEHPKSLTRQQYIDGERYCKLRIIELQTSDKGLRKVFLRDRLIEAQATEDTKRYKGIKRTMEEEE